MSGTIHLSMTADRRLTHREHLELARGARRGDAGFVYWETVPQGLDPRDWFYRCSYCVRHGVILVDGAAFEDGDRDRCILSLGWKPHAGVFACALAYEKAYPEDLG